MKGPSLQKTTAISAALHATLFLISMIVLRNSHTFVMPSAYTVNLVSSGGRPEAASVRPGEAVETVAKMTEPGHTAVKETRNAKEEQKRIDDRISEIASKKKIERIVNLRKAMVSIKGGTNPANAKSSGQAAGKGLSGGQAAEMSYADRVGQEIHKQWSYPDTLKKNLEAIVAVKVLKDGMISVQKVEKSSGDRLFDKFALKAIEMAQPVTPPPHEMEIGIRFTP
ncbi:MAG: TonB family protein [Nitrospirae bacterium]|nr:MAG: TonB family protein [Nitrospirota bacterium]